MRSRSEAPCAGVEATLAKAESLGGTRMMGPSEAMEGLVIGMFNDLEGHVIGLIKADSES